MSSGGALKASGERELLSLCLSRRNPHKGQGVHAPARPRRRPGDRELTLPARLGGRSRCRSGLSSIAIRATTSPPLEVERARQITRLIESFDESDRAVGHGRIHTAGVLAAGHERLLFGPAVLAGGRPDHDAPGDPVEVLLLGAGRKISSKTFLNSGSPRTGRSALPCRSSSRPAGRSNNWSTGWSGRCFRK